MERYRLFEHDLEKIEELLDASVIAKQSILKQIKGEKSE